MALISVLAQPGLAFMESANAARENRLAMAAAEAEQATARAQQEMRQRAFQALQTGQAGPEEVAAQLFGAGLTQEGTAALGMARAAQEANARRQQAINAALTSAAPRAAQSPEQFERTASAFAEQYGVSPDEARNSLRRAIELTAPQTSSDPTSVREYQFAVSQGETRSFNEWDAARRNAGRAQTNVNVAGPSGPQVGTIPQGFQLVQDPATGALRMEPIPGGPASREIEQAEQESDRANRQQRQAAQAAFARMNDTVDLLGRSAERVSPLTAGAGGAFLRNVPGTPAVDLAATIDTIRARFGFDELAAMRDASPTGGALGQVTVREIEFLQSVLRNFDLSQSPQQLRANLLEAEQLYQESMARIAEAYRADFGAYPPGFMQEASQQAPQGSSASGSNRADPLGLRGGR